MVPFWSGEVCQSVVSARFLKLEFRCRRYLERGFCGRAQPQRTRLPLALALELPPLPPLPPALVPLATPALYWQWQWLAHRYHPPVTTSRALKYSPKDSSASHETDACADESGLVLSLNCLLFSSSPLNQSYRLTRSSLHTSLDHAKAAMSVGA